VVPIKDWTRHAVIVSATKIAGTSHAGRALVQLSAWPSVRARRADCGLGIGVGTRGGQILHFHDEDHAALCLTQPVIDRFRDVLAQAGIDVVPDDDWIAMRLETPTDTSLLVTLVSVAIKANFPTPPHAPFHRMTPCRARAYKGVTHSPREPDTTRPRPPAARPKFDRHSNP
jgi:hypothetical protein